MGDPDDAGASRSVAGGTRSRPLLVCLAAGLLALTLYLLFWPVGVEPIAWRPPPDPGLTGPYAVNRRLGGVERIELDGSVGPEDVAVDGRGRLHVGTEDGRILRLDPDRPAAGPEVLARTGGRPMGLAFDRDGRLLVADLDRGLLAVSPGGRVTVLATGAGGVPLGRTNGVTVAPDGTVYFTDASHEHPDGPGFVALVAHRPAGRVLELDPETGDVAVLLDSLHFANGVTVAPDGRHVLVVETGAYRVRRIRRGGDRRGEWEILRSNLPGFPDGISTDPDGTFWLALASPRSRVLDLLMPRPLLRRVLLRIPRFLLPGPDRHGFVLALDREGRVVHNLQDPTGDYAPVTNAVRAGDRLYLGSDRMDALGWIRLPVSAAEAGMIDRTTFDPLSPGPPRRLGFREEPVRSPFRP